MLEEIIKNFQISNPASVSKISIGLINETYKIDANEGSFILQKLNPIFSPEVMRDVKIVSEHLEKRGVRTPKIIPTGDGRLWAEIESPTLGAKEIWRMFTYIPGDVYTKLENASLAYEAGKILGQFHWALSDLHYKFRHHRPMHHAIEKHLELFRKTIDTECPPQAQPDTRCHYGEIEELKRAIFEIKNLMLPKNLRRTITHGDPKISNVIFDNPSQPPLSARGGSAFGEKLRGGEVGLQAVALIDLDDVGNEHNVLVELGDAMRSWCGREEDDPENSFNLEFFESGLSGYLEGSKNFLTVAELKLLPQAMKLITLELASRFLRDYFEDAYFGWDALKYPSRKTHNLTRARGQIALYNDIVSKEREIASLCSQ